MMRQENRAGARELMKQEPELASCSHLPAASENLHWEFQRQLQESNCIQSLASINTHFQNTAIKNEDHLSIYFMIKHDQILF